MDVTFAYYRRSGLVETGGHRLLSLSPNLTREQVAFDAPLRQPLRFREAISALHDIVISDLRYKPRDKTAYEQWKRDQQSRDADFRRAAYEQARDEILARSGTVVAPEFERTFEAARRKYWSARSRYSRHLMTHDPWLWRMLMPCDPVITVADDVLFFECFSADESSYGCLTTEREGTFGPSETPRFGTTNVDYSWDLYNHFQTLRTYRETRFRVDPAGFEVATAGNPDYREEKIDLPPGWLRGFLQIQSAMTLPVRRVSLSREAVYSLLSYLKRHKARTSPRALRFELLPGKAPALVLEPWEQRIVSHGTKYDGPPGEAIRIWGRQRLLTLARVLPLADRIDVYLLGTGLPSFWIVRMGEMRLTLGLSGWTTNDWTRGSALDLLAPPAASNPVLTDEVAAALQSRRAAPLATLQADSSVPAAECAAALNRLALSGQVIYDLAAGVYRWRQVMPRALGEAELARDNPEAAGAKEIVAKGKIAITSQEDIANIGRRLTGKADGKPVELLLDVDGRIKRGKCVCSHHHRFGLRSGPCRHLLALRSTATTPQQSDASARDWYERVRKATGN